MGSSMSCRTKFLCFSSQPMDVHTPTSQRNEVSPSDRGSPSEISHRRIGQSRRRPFSIPILAFKPSVLSRTQPRQASWPPGGPGAPGSRHRGFDKTTSPRRKPPPDIILSPHHRISADSTSVTSNAPPSLVTSPDNDDYTGVDVASGSLLLPVPMHAQCFSCCESGNVSSLQFLMSAYPSSAFNMTTLFEVDIGYGNPTEPQTTHLTPLQTASLFGHPAVVFLLLARASTDCNAQDPVYGMTALHFALLMHNQAVATLLCQHSALRMCVVDRSGNTALHVAVKVGCEPVVTYLTRQHRARELPLHLANSDGNSLLHLAAMSAPGRTNIKVLLLNLLTRGWDTYRKLRRLKQLARLSLAGVVRTLPVRHQEPHKTRPLSFPLRLTGSPTSGRNPPTIAGLDLSLALRVQGQVVGSKIKHRVQGGGRTALGHIANMQPRRSQSFRFDLVYVRSILQMSNGDGLTFLDLLSRGLSTQTHRTDSKELNRDLEDNVQRELPSPPPGISAHCPCICQIEMVRPQGDLQTVGAPQTDAECAYMLIRKQIQLVEDILNI